MGCGVLWRGAYHHNNSSHTYGSHSLLVVHVQMYDIVTSKTDEIKYCFTAYKASTCMHNKEYCVYFSEENIPYSEQLWRNGHACIKFKLASFKIWQSLPNSPNRQIKNLAKISRYMVHSQHYTTGCLYCSVLGKCSRVLKHNS